MFSKLNYANCSKLEHQETTFSNVIPKNNTAETVLPSLTKLPTELQENLEKMQAFEERILNRCMTMDMLCRNVLDISATTESFNSVCSLQFEDDEDSIFAAELKKSLSVHSMDENCSEVIVDLVLKSLQKKKIDRNAWKKLKEFFKEFFWPQIVLGTASI